MTTRSKDDLQAQVQRQRTRQHFEWQKHVAARRDLKPAVKLILLRLALFRNLETERCDPSYGTLAKGAGVSDRTAMRAIEQAERLGLISISRTTGGRHANTNSFCFLTPAGVSAESPQRVTKRTVTGDKSSTGRVTPVSPKQEENMGDPKGSPCVSESSDQLELIGPLAAGDAALRAAPGEEAPPAGIEEASEQSADAYAELRTIWNRGHIEREDADRRAFEIARQHANDDDIIAGALAWRKAHDNPRFLPKLCDWLDQRGWEKPPPQRAAKRSKAASKQDGQYRNGKKFDGAGFALKYVGLINSDAGNGGIQ
jgi:Helix-turn-helix domain